MEQYDDQLLTITDYDTDTDNCKVLVTVNNTHGLLSPVQHALLVKSIVKFYAMCSVPTRVFNRQDAPDYIDIEE
jgi:hypothetical protein